MCPSPPPVSPPHPSGCPLAALARGGGHPARLQPCTLRGRLKNPPFGLRSRNSPSKMFSRFQVRVSLPAVLAEAASSPPEIRKNPQIAALRRKTADVRRTPRAQGAAPHPRGALSRHKPPLGGPHLLPAQPPDPWAVVFGGATGRWLSWVSVSRARQPGDEAAVPSSPFRPPHSPPLVPSGPVPCGGQAPGSRGAPSGKGAPPVLSPWIRGVRGFWAPPHPHQTLAAERCHQARVPIPVTTPACANPTF